MSHLKIKIQLAKADVIPMKDKTSKIVFFEAIKKRRLELQLYSLLTSATKVTGQHHAPAALTLEITPEPIKYEMGGTQRRSGLLDKRKISCPCRD
jgi:hypothetical protein